MIKEKFLADDVSMLLLMFYFHVKTLSLNLHAMCRLTFNTDFIHLVFFESLCRSDFLFALSLYIISFLFISISSLLDSKR